jgi:ABC-type uncharacterized transport system substrate-binding protein
VTSLARPEGNITGLTSVQTELSVKRLELLKQALPNLSRGRAGAVIILPNPFFTVHAARVADLALRYRLATMGAELAIVEAGGFMRYAANSLEAWRRAATYVDKILKGAKPADLPIEQPTKFDLVINLKTAKAFGLTIPPSLLLRADRVIE